MTETPMPPKQSVAELGLCGDMSPGGYICTLDHGHDGEHKARLMRNTDVVYSTWPPT